MTTILSLAGGALAPIVVLLVVLASDVWVYLDAEAQVRRGSPVEFRYGGFVVGTPAAWFVACLFLWIIFFPLYVTGRRQ